MLFFSRRDETDAFGKVARKEMEVGTDVCLLRGGNIQVVDAMIVRRLLLEARFLEEVECLKFCLCKEAAWTL